MHVLSGLVPSLRCLIRTVITGSLHCALHQLRFDSAQVFSRSCCTVCLSSSGTPGRVCANGTPAVTAETVAFTTSLDNRERPSASLLVYPRRYGIKIVERQRGHPTLTCSVELGCAIVVRQWIIIGHNLKLPAVQIIMELVRHCPFKGEKFYFMSRIIPFGRVQTLSV